MKWFARLAVLVFVLFAAMTMIHPGQPQAQGPDDEKPKNLKVLPKDMSHRQVVEVMRGFTSALGVDCENCHEQKNPGEEPDFASDKKPEKEAARKMMKMVSSINDQLAQMSFKDSLQVACVTCHHGVEKPQTLGARVMKTVHEKGVDGAIAEYRQLRTQYYGTAAYNFAPVTLNDVAGRLGYEDHDYDGAMKLLNVNLEFTPNDAGTYVTIGRVQLAKGDKTAAKASVQKALELDPNNRGARRLQQQIGQ